MSISDIGVAAAATVPRDWLGTLEGQKAIELRM